MRQIKLFIFFLVFLCASKIEAQTNFLKGYYINIDQDTLHGYIDYRSETRNYRLFVFKSELSSKSVTLYPKDILGFTILNTDFYEKHSFKSKKGEGLYGFFKVLIKGKLSLLRYQSRYFAKTETNEVIEITKRRIISEGQAKTDYFGLGMLKVLMKDCPETNSGFLENEYKSTPEYTYIFEKYNTCMEREYYKTKEIKIKPHIDFSVQVSPSITRISFSSSLKNATLNNTLSFGLGGFASIFIPKVDEKIRLVIEATYGRYNQYEYFSSDLTNNDLFIDYSFLKVPLLLRYNHNRVFFDVGIQNQFILNQELKWRVETVQQNTILTEDGQISPLSNSNGFMAGVGVHYLLSDYVVRSSLRFSQSKSSSHPNKPIYQNLEFVLSIQLTK